MYPGTGNCCAGKRIGPVRTVVWEMAGVRPPTWRTRARVRRGAVQPSSTPRADPRSRLTRGNAEDRLLSPLRRHRLLTVLGLLVAALAAATRFVSIGVLPPSIKEKPFAHATGSTEFVVGESWSFSHTVPDGYSRSVVPRAFALADMTASAGLANYVARAAGLPVTKIAILGPIWTELQRTEAWANGPKRASQIIIENYPYHITLDVQTLAPPWPPVINVATQAPNTEIAARLAAGVGIGLNAYLLHLQAATGVPKSDRYGVRQLAPVSVAPARTSQLASVGAFTFGAVFVFWCGLIVALSSVMRDLRAARDLRATAARSKVGEPFDRSSDSGPVLVGNRS